MVIPILERPIYECVRPTDGSWKNRHRNARVTPPIDDSIMHSNSNCLKYASSFVRYNSPQIEIPNFPGNLLGPIQSKFPIDKDYMFENGTRPNLSMD